MLLVSSTQDTRKSEWKFECSILWYLPNYDLYERLKRINDIYYITVHVSVLFLFLMNNHYLHQERHTVKFSSFKLGVVMEKLGDRVDRAVWNCAIHLTWQHLGTHRERITSEPSKKRKFLTLWTFTQGRLLVKTDWRSVAISQLPNFVLREPLTPSAQTTLWLE